MSIVDKIYDGQTPLVELASDIQALIEEKENYKRALELAVTELGSKHICAFPAHDPDYWYAKAGAQRVGTRVKHSNV